jgi:predicted nucleotidyltransferase
MATQMKLSQDFKEFVASLNKHEVSYLIVGGYAVGFHGHARYTKDLDVWIDATVENSRQLIDSLVEFGFGALGLTSNDFLTSGQVVQLGREPVRIDLLTSLKGVEFSNAIERALTVEVDGITCNVIGLDDLRASKAAAGRPQDLADLDHLS